MNNFKTSVSMRSIKLLRDKIYTLIFILIILFSILIPFMIFILSPWILFVYWSFLAIMSIILSYLYFRGVAK